jgi:fraxetin 5-hydroxylase
VVGGTDTAFVTLGWGLSLLLNHRHALMKAREELDRVIGKDRNVEESDLPKLVYIQAIVKETLRMYPPAPFSMPHENTEDCYVGGYRVPAGTLLWVNLWKLHRDPQVWSDPEEFRPERFLTQHTDVDVRGQHFEYIPFGSGRRGCPGISLGFYVLNMTLARLIHGFDLTTPFDAPVDMTETKGVTMPRANPLEVIVTPRLPSRLYE